MRRGIGRLALHNVQRVNSKAKVANRAPASMNKVLRAIVKWTVRTVVLVAAGIALAASVIAYSDYPRWTARTIGCLLRRG
jgi:hypothetical protein